MSYALFLVVNGATVIFLLWLFFGRRKPKPTTLNLRGGSPPIPRSEERIVTDIPNEELRLGVNTPLTSNRENSRYVLPSPNRDRGVSRESTARASEKVLTVIFMFNGESWDAYETLGLPAGSSLQSAEAAFEVAVQNTDPKSHAFFKAAIQAIRTSSSK
jgi:hypothetical protein